MAISACAGDGPLAVFLAARPQTLDTVVRPCDRGAGLPRGAGVAGALLDAESGELQPRGHFNEAADGLFLHVR